ncbi:hypothetical protein [Ahniella affigens]|uniref:hypothetical protein n=1 Tax=Ahniella affigens TaxID=2021234 RepID=UPI001472B26D|nr:hypothetical protein [Ahniella affigens]
MSPVRAAIAAAVLCAYVPIVASTEPSVSLDEAYRRVITQHPDLEAYRLAVVAR